MILIIIYPGCFSGHVTQPKQTSKPTHFGVYTFVWPAHRFNDPTAIDYRACGMKFGGNANVAIPRHIYLDSL